ncbi:hypothetical protein GF339_00890 [candidate division KSB3 bacterium]|uniref:Sulfotransferase family protein n=1 Tax=candidate division KSB3 bacterium TaxID=2044937 RepID=A0A9D5JRV5_9BACT|nr:hypothetical protein [candidate division KSB3 bacterium]MBD3323105.1 hypothetical protein [candidate division KSB3 bacterium]
MTFNGKLLIRVYGKSLFAHRETQAPITAKRLLFLLLFPPLYMLLELVNWICLGLDDICFSSYRHLDVQDPVFIVGFPRSGSTFLHRLLAKDAAQFTSMKLWEILFAPSILQKKFWLMVGAWDRKLGNPLSTFVLAFEKWQFKEVRKIHKIGLFEMEEDEIILLHIFSSAFLNFMFPFDDLRPLVNFDTQCSARQRRQIMTFYKRCIQRHLYVFGKQKHFLSKNPAFSSKIQSLGETFPTAKVICIVRNPLEAIPSAINWIAYGFNTFNRFDNQCAQAQRLLDWIAHWYPYPLEQLEPWPNHRKMIVNYTHLIHEPATLVSDLYDCLGFDLSDRFRTMLADEATRARHYTSQHRYSLSQFGMSAEQIVTDFQEIFTRFDFPHAESQGVESHGNTGHAECFTKNIP